MSRIREQKTDPATHISLESVKQSWTRAPTIAEQCPHDLAHFIGEVGLDINRSPVGTACKGG